MLQTDPAETDTGARKRRLVVLRVKKFMPRCG
jgi:hypothetical protein